MTRSTISVLCPTAHRGPLVAESLAALREAADEIVIAADSDVEANDLAYYSDVADVLVRYEFAGANRHWSWLAEQAHGDWVLLLDGDELPSAAFVAALSELVADRRVRQYSLPIHWPWPSPDVRLADEPWGSDRRLRLLRNDAGLAFEARKHGLAQPDPPIRFLDELPVYHLDLLLSDRNRREAKVAHSDPERFGLLTPEGIPFNQAFYLPEMGDNGRATVPLPREDADAVARAIAASGDPSRSLDPASVTLYRRRAVTWYAPRRGLSEDAYRATITLARPLPRFTAKRRDHVVWIEVANEGTARWPGREGRDAPVRLGVAWQPVAGGRRHEVGRAPLPHALDPGQRALVPVGVCAPPLSGPADLVIDVVHELVRWFNCALITRVEVDASVDERLADLVTRHGPLVPYAAVMEGRRAVGARDGLLRADSPARTPADPRIAELTASLPSGGWAVDGETINRLVELVRAERPSAIVEFGSGSNTVVLAALLSECHRDGPRLVSFEHDPAWADRSRAALFERNLGAMAAVIQLPFGARGKGSPGYMLTEEAAAALSHISPQLVLVDGPTLDSGALLGTIDLVLPYLCDDARVLLEYALRDAELCVAAEWEGRDDIVVHGIRPTAKGLLEATLHAPSCRLWSDHRMSVWTTPSSSSPDPYDYWTFKTELEAPRVEEQRLRDGPDRIAVTEATLRAEVQQLRDEHGRLVAAEATLSRDLAQARDEILRIDQSVTIQLFRRLRERLYGAIGQESLLAHVIQASLRLIGGILIHRGSEELVPPERVWSRYSSLPESVPRRPVTFNEKVRYKMLKDRRPLLTTFADKVAVRDYVAQKVGRDLLTQLYLVTEDPGRIRKESLPREFVIKPSHGCGAGVLVAGHAHPEKTLREPPAGWSRCLVTPDSLDWTVLRGLCREWLGLRYRPELEWAYENVPPRILAEELLFANGSIPSDYKFFVFHGRVRLVQVDFDRFGNHVRDLYSPGWDHIPVAYCYDARSNGPDIERPESLPEMISIAERLGQETDFIRVDLYDVGDRIVFGEMTNYPTGGTGPFEPASFDYELGSWWSLPKRYR